MKPTILAALAVLVPLAPTSSPAQESKGRPPALPGAITQAPAWLTPAPFDLKKFFETPSDAENAAPLYLDALLEFGTEVAVCFPDGAPARVAATQARSKRFVALYSAWQKDPRAVRPADADAVVAEYREGLRKLALAQAKPKCVFAVGFDLDSLLPHVQAARGVARVMALKTHGDLAKGDFDAATANAAAVLRLSRDLRPRGPIISQLVSLAIDGICMTEIVQPILRHPKLQAKHCDRLVALLKEHESKGVDPYATGIAGDWVMQRVAVRTIERGQKMVPGPGGRPVDKALRREDLAKYLGELFAMGAAVGAGDSKVDVARLGDDAYLRELSDRFSRMGIDPARERRAADEFARSMLALASATPSERSRKDAELVDTYFKNTAARPLVIMKLLAPTYGALSQACARSQANVRLTTCLAALRRWEIANRAAPKDLAAACKAAGLASVPLDPYTKTPLRLADVGGSPVVYSVGKDGRDDKGRVDAEMGRKEAGDFVLKLRAEAAR